MILASKFEQSSEGMPSSFVVAYDSEAVLPGASCLRLEEVKAEAAERKGVQLLFLASSSGGTIAT